MSPEHLKPVLEKKNHLNDSFRKWITWMNLSWWTFSGRKLFWLDSIKNKNINTKTISSSSQNIFLSNFILFISIKTCFSLYYFCFRLLFLFLTWIFLSCYLFMLAGGLRIPITHAQNSSSPSVDTQPQQQPDQQK